MDIILAASRYHITVGYLHTQNVSLLLLYECWCRQVCSGDAFAARVFHTYMQHAEADATGRPPPEPLEELQASTSGPREREYLLHNIRRQS